MAWGVFFRHPQQSTWEDAPTAAHDERSLAFIRQYNVQGSSPERAMSSSAPHQYPYPSHIVPQGSWNAGLAQSPPSSNWSMPSPQFKKPLSTSVLHDPAFSPDPRAHPHFPLTDAASYKELPFKSPLIDVHDLADPSSATPFNDTLHHGNMHQLNGPVAVPHYAREERHPSPPASSSSESSESETPTMLTPFTSPTVSSSSSHVHSPVHAQNFRPPSPVAPLSPSPPPLSASNRPPVKDGKDGAITSTEHYRPTMLRNESTPEARDRPQHPVPARSKTAPTHADGSNRPSGKRRVKNFVRRIANFGSLDRIDELDETDPFGGSWHHGGPYEAIGSNLAELGPAHMYNDVSVLRGDMYRSKRENDISRAIPKQVRDKPARVRSMPVQSNNGTSLNLAPGQILRHMPTYDEQLSTLNRPQAEMMIPSPNLFRRKPVSDGSRSDHHRTQSLPHRPNPSFGEMADSSDNPRPEHPRRENIPPASRHHPSGDDHQMNSLDQGVLPVHGDPTQHRRRPVSSVVAPTSQNHLPRDMSPSRHAPTEMRHFIPSSEQAQSAERQVSNQVPQTPRHNSTRSLDSSRTHTTTSTQSSSQGSSQTQYSQPPPRNHHLPKRLVMPALLQPQPPPPQHQYPFSQGPPEPYAYIEIPLSPPRGKEPPMMYTESRRLLRKKTAVFPANVPLPLHVPSNQAQPVPMAIYPSKAVEVEKTKEGAHRRRLSKRKNDS
ncbi:hypothetical protein BV22DRAFT_1028250 [Leucogyrophana mollusca]|uniref:Uncharacterized protein n=1 Tax=Leucogyrophana mollusca TaxID=85980 RepID=A0ACB8C0T3_9AGAM|nr:hypothetical protein BV22DRAFT_1028250 [Leucogyrophana mollusca]